MAKAIREHRAIALVVAVIAGIAVVASCLLEMGGSPSLSSKPSALSFKSDPSGLPIDDLIDDWFVLHYRRSPDGYPRWLVSLLVGLKHSLGAVDESSFELMEAIDRGGVDHDTYPSLYGLDSGEQAATVILAVLELSPGFEGNFAGVVRLVYGEAKTVLEVAVALNQANSIPIADEEIQDLRFLDHGLVFELARGYDAISGCSREDCRAGPATVVENPVIQWLVAYRAGLRARHAQDDRPPRKPLWKVETEEELNRLMYLLGDHQPPGAPKIEAVPSPIAANPIGVSGAAEASSFVDIAGAAQPAEVQADETGAFFIVAWLRPNQPNPLSIRATDRAGNVGPSVELVVVHDDLPPEVMITQPADGAIVETESLEVLGMAIDASPVAVAVNGIPAVVSQSIFSLDCLPVEYGLGTIQAVATDAAGNHGRDVVAVYRPQAEELPPSGFGVVGPEGGSVSAERPKDPFVGARLEVGEGALGEEKVIVIRAGLGAPPIRDFIPVGPIYELQPPDLAFGRPVTLVLPYDPAAIPAWATEEQTGVYLVEPGADGWTLIEGTVLADQDRVAVQVVGFSFVVAGIQLLPVFQICEASAVHHFYDCGAPPEESPAGAWRIARADEGVVWHSDGEKLHVDAYESQGAVEFYRVERLLATAHRYQIEVGMHVARSQPEPDGWPNYLTDFAFGASDGIKDVAVWGYSRNQALMIPAWGDFSLAGVDLMTPAEYRLIVDRSHADAAEHDARLYRDGVLLLNVPYDLLPNAPSGRETYLFGIAGYGTDTVWDFVEYDVCAEPDFDLDGLPNAVDNCPWVYNPRQADYDLDGVGDDCERTPSISIASPADMAVTAEPAALVTGAVEDPDGDTLSIRVNGVDAFFDGTNFRAPVPLDLGVNTLTANVLDRGGNGAEASILVYRGEPETLPDLFEPVSPGSETVIEATRPGSPIKGTRVVVPAGAVLGPGFIVIGKGAPAGGLGTQLVEVGPPVAVRLEGTDLVGEISVRVPFSVEILRFFRLPELQVKLLLHELDPPSWEVLEGAMVDISTQTVEVETDRLSMFQAGIPSPEDIIVALPLVGVPREIAPECESRPWPGNGVGLECVLDSCVCPPGAYGGQGMFSKIEDPTDLDTALVGGEVVLAYNEPYRAALNYARPRHGLQEHLGLMQTDEEYRFEESPPGMYYSYTALAITFEEGVGIVWHFAKMPILVTEQGENFRLPSRIYRFAPDVESAPRLLAGGGADPEDGAPALDAEVNVVDGIDVAADGSVYFAESRTSQLVRPDTKANRVRVIKDGMVTTVAGTGDSGFLPGPGDTQPALATTVPLNFPTDTELSLVKLDGNVVFIVDSGNSRVRALNISHLSGAPTEVTLGAYRTAGQPIVLQPGEMQTLLGTGEGLLPCPREPLETYGLEGPSTPLSCPQGLAVVRACHPDTTCLDKYLVVSDNLNHQLLVMSLLDFKVTRFAGVKGEAGYHHICKSTEAKMHWPRGISYSREADILFFADGGNNAIRMIEFQDRDDDWIGNSVDNCRAAYNPDQFDSDGDGVGDVCDNCPSEPSANQDDDDRDGFGNVCDNCPGVRNPDQADNDRLDDMNFPSSVPWVGGDVCDLDDDNDGINDKLERHIGTNPFLEDTDGDGVDDWTENFFETDPLSDDSDGDGLGDLQEYDANGDGAFSYQDLASPGFDRDGDGVPDAAECNDCDSDGDGIVDDQDPTDDRDIPVGQKWLVEALWEVSSLKQHTRHDPSLTIDNESHNLKFVFRVAYILEWNGTQFIQTPDSLTYKGDLDLMGEVVDIMPLPVDGEQCFRYAVQLIGTCFRKNCLEIGWNKDIRRGEYVSTGYLPTPSSPDIWFNEDQFPPDEASLGQSTAHYWEHRIWETAECSPYEGGRYKYHHVLAGGLANDLIPPGTMRDPDDRFGGSDVAYAVPKLKFIKDKEFFWEVQFDQVIEQKNPLFLLSDYHRELSFFGTLLFKKNDVSIRGDDTIVHLCDFSNGHNWWHADAYPPGGTYRWEIARGGQNAQIVSGADTPQVTLASIQRSAYPGDVLLRVTYTTPEGVTVEDERPITVQQPHGLSAPVRVGPQRYWPYYGYQEDWSSYVVDEFGQRIVAVGDANMTWEERKTYRCHWPYEAPIPNLIGVGGRVFPSGEIIDTLGASSDKPDKELDPLYKAQITQEIWVNDCRYPTQPIEIRCHVLHNMGSEIVPHVSCYNLLGCW